MRVLWVYFDIGTGNYLHYHHGVGAIDATLRESGHDTKLLYFQKAPSRVSIWNEVEKYSPDAVFFPINTHQWMYARQVCDWIKEKFNILTVAGGIHAILDPENVIKHPTLDAVCICEGEYPSLELVEKLAQGKPVWDTDGFYFKKDGEVIRNRFVPLVENLDSIPISRREIWDMESTIEDQDWEVQIMGSRGCPYKCHYCANSGRMRAYKGYGKFIRQRSVDHVLKEIEILSNLYHFGRIFFEDDVFIMDKDWASEFCKKYKSRFSYPFKVYIRVEDTTYEILRELKDAGCHMVSIGVEAGSERLRKRILNRHMSNDDIIKVFRWLDELEMKIWDFNMIGFPEETKETIEDLFALNRTLRPHIAQISIYYPYPGTALYRICEKKNLLSTREQASYFEHSTLKLPNLSDDYIKQKFFEFRDESLKIRAERYRKGYFDFVERLDDATIKSDSPEPVKRQLFQINGLSQVVILAHPRSKVSWELSLKPNSVLRGLIGMYEYSWQWGGEGAFFVIQIEDETGKAEVFRRYIDPKNRLNDRRWIPVEVDLDRWSGKNIKVSLITETGPSSDLTGLWCGWNAYLAQS